MVDIHSHILPGIDDGAKSREESLQLLKMMKEQGISEVIATPHFVPGRENLESFLNRVVISKNELFKSEMPSDIPKIYFGSEIYYFHGMGDVESLKALTLADSKYLLIDFTFTELDDYVIKDIINLDDNFGIIPIIAHIERYYHFKGFKKLLKCLESGIGIAQINADSVLDPDYQGRIKKLVKSGYVSIVATDSHSVKNRPPRLAEAYKELRRLCGDKNTDRLISSQENLRNRILGV